MYQSSVAFEAPLSPRMFFATDAHALENKYIFETTWQMIGLASSISLPGQFLSMNIGNIPVVVRNFDGRFVALRNVCAHRHCSLVSAALGQSEKLKCPFHGWEYGSDGKTRKIPAAKNFPDFDRERYKLDTFSVEQCGDLLFVRCTDQGPSLKEWLGDLFGKFEEWTSLPHGKCAVTRSLAMPANWKIPIEGSLESYHIPEVHRQTFGEDPGESKSDHVIAKYSTSFFTLFNTPRVIDKLLKIYEGFILKILGVAFNAKYEHHHVLPNLLISHTDSLTLVQTVRPVTSESSISHVWQYARQSVRRNPFSTMTAYFWGKFTGWLSYQILKEDLGIFPHVQRGERAATDHAILGRCEERLYVFEKFLSEQFVLPQGQNSVKEDFPKSDRCQLSAPCADVAGEVEASA